jgi:putative tryptophan/tyrosine transport system substrate-binding protein
LDWFVITRYSVLLEAVMRRREVLTGFWLAVALPPVQAQPSGQMYRIAVIHPSHPTTVLNETGGLRYFKGLFGELRRLSRART